MGEEDNVNQEDDDINSNNENHDVDDNEYDPEFDYEEQLEAAQQQTTSQSMTSLSGKNKFSTSQTAMSKNFLYITPYFFQIFLL